MMNYLLELKENKVSVNSPVSPAEIESFELKHHVILPVEMRELFYLFNGFVDDEMYNMYRIWQLNQLQRVTQYFSVQALMTNTTPRMEESNNNGKSVYSSVVDNESNWVIPNAENYFLFADYNINASYWAVQLTQSKDTTGQHVICIHDVENSYRVVSQELSQFLRAIRETGPENLL